MTDTIPAPAPLHTDACPHSDCTGECRRPRPPIVEKRGFTSTEGGSVEDQVDRITEGDTTGETCANMPKAERRPKVGDDVVNLVGGRCRGFRVSYVNDDCLEAKTGADPAAARIVRVINMCGVTWDFDEETAKSDPPDPLRQHVNDLRAMGGYVLADMLCTLLNTRDRERPPITPRASAEHTAAAVAKGRRELAGEALAKWNEDDVGAFVSWLCAKATGL